jgi:putative oxygen-independent coproporphyrinogen III oxidase
LAHALSLETKAPENGLFSEQELVGSSNRTFHAYVHIPFCTTRCGYCDFNTYTALELGTLRQSDYAKSLISEIVFSGEVLQISKAPIRKLTTVFFGGGTPTLLPASDLISMLNALEAEFGFEKEAEITFEANPDTITEEKLELLREAGFNRVSIGMQSAVNEVLAVLDRTHNPDNVAKAIQIAKGLGFQTSLDLIYGAPSESLPQWEHSIKQAIDLDPGHISAYSLIVEPGTKLARQIASGELPEPDEDLQAEKYELADSLLADAGFQWYEISNWAKSTKLRSRHNLAYWSSQDWWGYGPGAHSHMGSVRWWNQKHPLTYSSKLEQFVSPASGREKLEASSHALERVLLESRTAAGISLADLESLNSGPQQVVSELIADGLIDRRSALSGQLKLTLRGRLLADAVVRKLTA